MPVLVTPMLYRAIKDKPATIVFMLPNKIKNCFLSFSPVMSEPITAACPEPSAGRKEHKGADKTAAIPELANSFLLTLILVIGRISCLGSFCFLIIEVINEDAPNKPVNNGKRDSFIFRFKVDKPRKPARKKTSKAFRDFSLTNKYKEAKTRIKNITVFMYV